MFYKDLEAIISKWSNWWAHPEYMVSNTTSEWYKIGQHLYMFDAVYYRGGRVVEWLQFVYYLKALVFVSTWGSEECFDRVSPSHLRYQT